MTKIREEVVTLIISLAGEFRKATVSRPITADQSDITNKYADKFIYLSRSWALEEKKEELDEIYCELRGLLKKDRSFPDKWDTDEALEMWLEENDPENKR